MIKKAHVHDNNITEGPIMGKLIRFALPLFFTGVLQLLFSATDMAVVGRFSPNGTMAVGAIGACGPLINLIISTSMGLSLGVSVAVAHDKGSGATDKIGKVVHTALLTGLFLGAFVCIGG